MALFIDQSKQVAGLPGQKIQDVLIVTELHVFPHNALLLVLFLLQLEDVCHEELLQLLISKVNAELLEAVNKGAPFRFKVTVRLWCSWKVYGLPVCVEVLKPKDIEQADGQVGGFGAVGQ